MMNIDRSELQHIRDNLWIKRDDLIDPLIGGNKFRKLKYNLIEARNQHRTALLTFGGAYSNHILATARTGHIEGIKTIGIIRGHAEHELSPVLKKVQELGMELNFIDRTEYKLRHDKDYLDKLQKRFSSAYIIPEGGTNAFALDGVAEIRTELPDDVDCIATACGSGGTLAGLIKAYHNRSNITLLGFSVLKGEDQLTETINQLLKASGIKAKCKWEVITGYHFGGYAKAPETLIDYIRTFQAQQDIPLDYVYTGKMLFGLESWLQTNTSYKKVVALHTGGLFTASIETKND